jgi:hypothetical protein
MGEEEIETARESKIRLFRTKESAGDRVRMRTEPNKGVGRRDLRSVRADNEARSRPCDQREHLLPKESETRKNSTFDFHDVDLLSREKLSSALV